MSPVFEPQQPILHNFSDPDKDAFDLPPVELVRKALLKLAAHGTQLIVWGALLDQHLHVPRIDFTFVICNDELEEASEILTSMHLPLTAPRPLLLLTEGDLYRSGYHHRITNKLDDASIRCIRLVPASLPAFAQDELEPITVDGVPVYVPRTSAVYASITRLMKKYRRSGPERRRLASDLELLVNYNLLGVYRAPTDEDDSEEFDMERQVAEAESTIRGWGEAGEWREGEEWVEDALVRIVRDEMCIDDLPSRSD
ncbi:hypothetical protein K488DRAFT_43794 [Vararia minispora EC-137]|uniref:Uncharacterized protein n=1 Tax=Vararia minispora EC-137 TaxID=1314806 RepID=A0ACB8QUC8_9AGAM|nr:hypothetical protein K488DRAFT_43794 [Vararia minispora EC-137]